MLTKGVLPETIVWNILAAPAPSSHACFLPLVTTVLIPDFITYNTLNINFYNGIIVFRRGKPQPIIHEVVGNPDIIYRLSTLLPKSLVPFAKRVRNYIKL